MHLNIFLFLGTVVLCGFGCLLYLAWRQKRSVNKEAKENVAKKETKPEKATTIQQQLLQQLTEQRKKTALLQYRQDCAAFFYDISSCIQDMLAQEVRSYTRDSVLCQRLTVTAGNENLAYKINKRKFPREPQPLTAEEATADVQTLEILISQEQQHCSKATVDIPWETVVKVLLPFLDSILHSAEAGDAEQCRHQLKQIRKTLLEQKIHPRWYQELSEQERDEMYWDFVHSPGYPIPALYYKLEDRYVHVGIPGRTGENIL